MQFFLLIIQVISIYQKGKKLIQVIKKSDARQPHSKQLPGFLWIENKT